MDLAPPQAAVVGDGSCLRGRGRLRRDVAVARVDPADPAGPRLGGVFDPAREGPAFEGAAGREDFPRRARMGGGDGGAARDLPDAFFMVVRRLDAVAAR